MYLRRCIILDRCWNQVEQREFAALPMRVTSAFRVSHFTRRNEPTNCTNCDSTFDREFSPHL
jgi:hypothetical protein